MEFICDKIISEFVFDRSTSSKGNCILGFYFYTEQSFSLVRYVCVYVYIYVYILHRAEVPQDNLLETVSNPITRLEKFRVHRRRI